MLRTGMTALLALAGVALPAISHAQACIQGSAVQVPVTIDNTGNALGYTDLEVKVTVDTATPIAAGHMQPDGRDIRFTDGTNCIPHAVESGLDSAATQIWVRMPVVPADAASTLYMYYGNPAAASADDPQATFSFYEGFDDADLNLEPDSCGAGAVDVAGGIGTVSWVGSFMLLAGNVFPVGRVYIAEAEMVNASGDWPGFYWFKNDADMRGYGLMTASAQARISKSGTGTGACQGHNWASGFIPTTHEAGRWSLAWHDTGDIRAEHPSAGPITSTDTQHARDADLRLGLGGITSGTGSIQVDWIRARQWVASEPSSSEGPPSPTLPDVSVDLDAPLSAVAGGSVSYVITVGNAGTNHAFDVLMQDSFPAVLDCSWTCTASDGATCTASGTGDIADTIDVPAGASAVYSVACDIDASATGTLSNTVTLTPASADFSADNNSATADTTLALAGGLSITTTDGNSSVVAGSTVQYVITASNAGPSDAPGSVVTDTFPASLSSCSWTCAGSNGGTCSAAGSGDINETVDLPAGGSVTFTASCQLAITASGTLSNTAEITAPAGMTDPDTSDNSSTDTTTILAAPAADVSARKTVTGHPRVGGQMTYQIVLGNEGTGAQGDNPGDELVDVLPPQLQLVSASATAGTAVADTASNTVTWNGPIPAGGSVTVTIVATVRVVAVGTVVSNQAVVSFDALGNGINGASRSSDDPGQPGAADPTTFSVAATLAPPLLVPVLDSRGLLLLGLLLAAVAGIGLRRRQ